jgi:undecaprenyl diphosphate synthase
MSEIENKIPFHVAIIPDGNRRWARGKGMESWEGHKAGADIIEELTKEALNLGIKCLSFWGSSVDNIKKRPLEEKKALLDIYETYFERLISNEEIYNKETRINILGLWEEQFPDRLNKILKKGIDKTRSHTKHFLNFLLAYNGDDDILHAVKRISQKVRNSEKEVEVTKEMIKENLITHELPNVDLIIRTGVEGDPHNSAGFLMWQTQNSQYHFSEKFFPDFNVEEFRNAIQQYASKEKRFGK